MLDVGRQGGLVDLLGYELDHLIRLPSTSKTTLVNLTHFNQRLKVRAYRTLMGPVLVHPLTRPVSIYMGGVDVMWQNMRRSSSPN